MTLRNVVFDIGNVLLLWDPRYLYGNLFAGRPKQMEWFLETVCTPAWNLEQDGGRTWADGVGALVAAYPEWRAEIEAFDRRWQEMIPHAIEGTVQILRDLKQQGVRLFAITNFSSEKYLESLGRFDFFGMFEGVIVSGDERLLKPHAPIFNLLLSRYGLDAAECLFVDDNAENVAGAAAVGMAAVHFTGPDTLRTALREHGFAI
jgi:2-haloacid dehalogenase